MRASRVVLATIEAAVPDAACAGGVIVDRADVHAGIGKWMSTSDPRIRALLRRVPAWQKR